MSRLLAATSSKNVVPSRVAWRILSPFPNWDFLKRVITVHSHEAELYQVAGTNNSHQKHRWQVDRQTIPPKTHLSNSNGATTHNLSEYHKPHGLPHLTRINRFHKLPPSRIVLPLATHHHGILRSRDGLPYQPPPFSFLGAR